MYGGKIEKFQVFLLLLLQPHVFFFFLSFPFHFFSPLSPPQANIIEIQNKIEMTESQKLKLAYLGPKGTYSHEVCT